MSRRTGQEVQAASGSGVLERVSCGASCLRGSFQALSQSSISPPPQRALGAHPASLTVPPTSQLCVSFQPQPPIYVHLLLLTQNQTPETNR